MSVITNPTTGHRYLLGRQLGAGSFGTVYEGRSEDGIKVAIKTMRFSGNPQEFYEETSALQLLSRAPQCHPYIVCMYDAFLVPVHSEHSGMTYSNDGMAVIISELMDGDIDSEKRRPQDDEIIPLLESVLKGLVYMHSRGLAHRDIKPANILRQGRRFKIGDVGLACMEGFGPLQTCSYGSGTPLYMSPESSKQPPRQATLADYQKEDVWALALVIFLFLYGDFPFRTSFSSIEQLQYHIAHIKQSDLDIIFNTIFARTSSEMGRDLLRILHGMMQVDPRNRLNSQQALEQVERYIQMYPQSVASTQMSLQQGAFSGPARMMQY